MGMNPRLLRPRASGFDPRRIAGLALWLDAADSATLFTATTGGSTPGGGAGVGRWEDKSGNGRHVTQGIANNRPLRTVASVNGRDVLTFDGTDDSFGSTNTVTFAQPYTTLAVVSHSNITGAQSDIFDGSTSRNVLGKVSNAGGVFFYGGSSSISVASGLTNGIAAVAAAVANSTQSVLRFNGQQVASGNTGNGALSGTLRIGTNNGASGEFWKGAIMELLFYSSALPADDIATVEKYLARKWGVTF